MAVDIANVLVGDAEITLDVGVDAVVIGYTVDGVSMTVGSDMADIKVEENEGTILRRLVNQEVSVTLNVAEGTLVNLQAAMAGSSINVGGDIVTIGGSALQEHRITLNGTAPSGYPRVIVLTLVNPTGEVTTPYKKGDISVVPMTFSALIDDSSEFGTISDAAAAAPTFVSATTNAGGTLIIVTFSKVMAASVGKHLEFWFTRDGAAGENFSLAGTAGTDISLTPIANILNAEVILLFYALGTVMSNDVGVLASLASETVTNIVP